MSDTKETKTIPPHPDLWINQDDHKYDGYSQSLFGAQKEYSKPVNCQVTGTMPEWLTGCFIRVGPGHFKWGKTEVKHWFDGDAIAHRFVVCLLLNSILTARAVNSGY